MLAEPSSAASLAEAIVALYERDLEAVGAAARARVLQHFTWAQAFESQLNTYLSLVGAPQPSTSRELAIPASG